MKQRKREIDAAREMELAYLVEGQANSVCAIRLKETLPLKKAKVVIKDVLNQREKLRIQELML